MDSLYNPINIDNFRAIARQEYPKILQQAVQIILIFSTTYLCESAFSSLSQIKTKSRSQVKSIKNERRVCLTFIPPRIKTFCAQKQARLSH